MSDGVTTASNYDILSENSHKTLRLEFIVSKLGMFRDIESSLSPTCTNRRTYRDGSFHSLRDQNFFLRRSAGSFTSQPSTADIPLLCNMSAVPVTAIAATTRCKMFIQTAWAYRVFLSALHN